MTVDYILSLLGVILFPRTNMANIHLSLRNRMGVVSMQHSLKVQLKQIQML